MSINYNHLRKILKTQKGVKNAASISPTSTQKPSLSPTPISIKDIADEPDLDLLAKKLNKLSFESNKFRNRHNIFDFSIARFALNKRYNLIEEVVQSHKKLEDITREGYGLRLMSFYAKAGMFDHARKLFDELPELGCKRTVRIFNALLNAGVVAKRFDDVLTLFEEIPSKLSIERNVVSYNTVIRARCEVGSVDEALLMLDEMKEKGVCPSTVTFNTLLNAFYREKGFEGGERIWDLIDEYNVVRDARSYYLKMQALIDIGKVADAVDLFKSLKETELKLDVNTFNVLMKERCEQGDVQGAISYYNEMLESGVLPNGITFAALVPQLCNRGDFEMAVELCKKMFKRQFVVDKALLQRVVDGMVKGSMNAEAAELVKLGRSNSYYNYDLEMPSEDAEQQEHDHST